METARMAQPTYEQLETRVRQLEAQNARLEARIAHLERLLEKATRDGKRQAAPFSKGPPKEKPKKPGRKSGTKYGPKAHRPLPKQEPDEIVRSRNEIIETMQTAMVPYTRRCRI